VDEMAELREHSAAQAALLNLGAEDAVTKEKSTGGDQIGE